MKHSDWLAVFFALIILIRPLVYPEELTTQDAIIIANIYQALEKTPLKNDSYWFFCYAKKYKQDPYLSPAIAILETSAGKKCPAPYNAFCQKNRRKDQKKLGKWRRYKSFEEAIKHNNKNIQRLWGNYATPEKMTSGRIKYTTSWRKWRRSIKRYMRWMEGGEKK